MGKPERIIVVGAAKSGTTALFYRIKNSISEKHIGIFEPERFEVIHAQSDPKSTIIAKVLIRNAASFLDEINNYFNKKILIVRDPRDIFISGLLYAGGYDFMWKRTPTEILQCIDLLKIKEKDPNAISVLKLFRHMWDSSSQEDFSKLVSAHTKLMIELADTKGYVIVRYEDMIENKLEELENYLGVKITSDTKIDKEFSRVIRTKGSGSWKDWFLQEDIDYFREMFDQTIKYFNYDMEWKANKQKIIEPQHSSEYVKRVVNERRKNAGLSLI